MTDQEFPPRKVICVGAVILKDEKVLLVRQAQGQSLEGRGAFPGGLLNPMKHRKPLLCGRHWKKAA